MGVYVNPGNDNFKESLNSDIYVDKSMLIHQLNKVIKTENKFVSVSRPRRFGKSMAGNMIASYYSIGCDSKELFSSLKISSDYLYLNKFNVLKFDMGAFYSIYPENTVSWLEKKIKKDFIKTFPLIDYSDCDSIADCLMQSYLETKIPFVIIIDEYDVLIREKTNCDVKSSFLRFLNGLFKNSDLSPALALVYITGILPIIKDKVGSKLNNFNEYTMLNAGPLAEYTGFTSSECNDLCNKYLMSYSECSKWYNGYNLDSYELYSPSSVVSAMLNHRYDDYWTQTGSFESIKDYILLDFNGIKDDVIKMLSGESIKVNTSKFQNSLDAFKSKDDVFTYLIHLGYLAYNEQNEECYIPNYEIKKEWINSIEDESDYFHVVEIIRRSKKLLDDVYRFDNESVAKQIERIHMEITSNMTYNNEGAFLSVIRLAFFYAQTYYNIYSELPTGKGYADCVFIPYDKNRSPIVIELKKDKSAYCAIKQIKDKEYYYSLESYKGNIILVGINYSTKTKEHSCIIEKA